MYQDLKFKTFFSFKEKKYTNFAFFKYNFLKLQKKNCWIVNLNFKQYKKINNHKLVYI